MIVENYCDSTTTVVDYSKPGNLSSLLFPAAAAAVKSLRSWVQICWSSKLHSLGAPPLVTSPQAGKPYTVLRNFTPVTELLCSGDGI